MQDKNLSEKAIYDAIDKSQVLTIPASEAKDHSLKDLGLDSLDLISLSMLFEDEHKLAIDIDNLKTDASLADLISGLQPIKE